MTNSTAESKNGRQQRTKKLLDDIMETQMVNLIGIEFLRGIIEDHSDRVYHGVLERPDSNLIVRGELANYCIPLERIIQSFANPFVDSFAGLPTVEVHPNGPGLGTRYKSIPLPTAHHFLEQFIAH